jgi:hypothetical protein
MLELAEEPGLVKRFGDYLTYKRNVPRWIPRVAYDAGPICCDAKPARHFRANDAYDANDGITGLSRIHGMESSSNQEARGCQASGGVNRGLVCRKCGSRHFLVVYTRPRDGCIVRSRKCRNCGTRMITWERPVGTAALNGDH